MVAIILRCRTSTTAGQCAAIKAGREYAPALIVLTAGWWDRAWAMLFHFLSLFCNSQLPTSPCHQQIIKIHEGGPQGQRDVSSVDLLEESPNAGGAQGTPQPAAAGREVQAPWTGAEQNTDSSAHCPHGTREGFHSSSTTCGSKGGSLCFCSNHPLPDLAATVLLWLSCCYHLPRLWQTYLEVWLDKAAGHRLRVNRRLLYWPFR